MRWESQSNYSFVKSELEKTQCFWAIYVSIKLKIIPNWITCLKSQFSFICEPYLFNHSFSQHFYIIYSSNSIFPFIFNKY